MQIYSVNGDFYTSYDLAAINALGTNFFVKTHELDETEEVEIDKAFDSDKLTIIQENGRVFEIEFDVEFDYYSEEEFSDAYTDHNIIDIQIEGHSINTMNISKDLKKDIWHEVDSVAYAMAEDKHENR